MGLLLLVLALSLFGGVVALGVWAMVRVDARLSGSPDSVLSQWAAEQRVGPRHR